MRVVKSVNEMKMAILLSGEKSKLIISMIREEDFGCNSDWRLLLQHADKIDYNRLIDDLKKFKETKQELIQSIPPGDVPAHNAKTLYDFIDKYQTSSENVVGVLFEITDFDMSKNDWLIFTDLVNDDFRILDSINFKTN